MKRILLFPYHLIRWIILLVIILSLLLLLVIEKPSLALSLLKAPLKEQGISYGEISGGLLSGFTLHDVNYQEKAKIKEVTLKVDLNQLENRLLYIENLKIEGVEIERDFLKSLIENNSSNEESDEGNSTLPFDRIIVKHANISLKKIGYQNYFIKEAKLEVNDLSSDMKKQHKGDLYLLLDSNVTQLDLNASIENENVTIISDVVPNRNFIATFITKYNLQLNNDPHFKIKANGNMHHVNYELITHRLSLQQDQYKIQSKKFQLSGEYDLDKKDLHAILSSDLKGNMASLQLDSDVKLNLDDLNNTLNYKLDGDFSPKYSFLTNMLKEQNVTFYRDPKVHIESQGNLKSLTYHLRLNEVKLKQNEYQLQSATVKLNGKYSVTQQNLMAVIESDINSNVAKVHLTADSSLNLQDLNNSLTFDAQGDILAKEPFLDTLLKEQNITIQKAPALKFQAKGDLQDLNYRLDLAGLKLKQNSYHLNNESIKLQGKYSVTRQDLIAELKSDINSNVANLHLTANSSLNLQDLNNSLSFDSQGDILTKAPFLNSLLKEQNISIQKAPKLDFEAKGKLDKIIFSSSIKELKLKQNDLHVALPWFKLNGETNALGGDTKVKLAGHVDSSAGMLDLKNKTALNFKDLNKTLLMDNDIKLELNPRYVNTKIKEHNITLEGKPKMHLTAKGNLNNLTLQMDAKTQLRNENNLSKISLHTSPIKLDVAKHHIEGSLKLSSDAKHIGLNIESQFNGDYTQPKKIQSKTDVQVKNFNAFGINLTPLAPLKLQVQSESTGAKITVDSERIQLHATTADYDHYRFDIKSRNLYLYKMMELPPELDHKFIKLDLKGSATLSKEYFKLNGYLYSNKKFKATINASNTQSGLNATLSTKHLALKATGDLKKKNIDASIKIDSLEKVQKEFNALYAFETIEVDGKLQAEARIRGENIVAKVNSAKLSFKDFNVEQLDINADYKKELLTLHKFQFNTTGFEDKKLNKKFYLKQKGLVHLGERRDVFIEMHPDIHIKATGDKNSLNGTFKIKKLPLGHPEYGSLILSTDIDYQQEGKRKTITGDITLKKMKLFYEAKFLDPANDPDVVIITKKDKKKKEHSEDTFLNYTAIDLNIKAPQANYKTADIDLLFDINLKANKAFGEELALLGKVEEINGRVDQVPKRFMVVDSNIVFKGGKKINPLLDINVEYELPQVLIHIAIGGDANHPKIEFTSEPPMPKKDIMSYLLLGVSTASLAEGEGSLSREAELFILNQAARDLAYELELDRVFIKDDGTGEGFAIEAGKKISKKNMVIIESSKEGNSFILEHDINKNIKLRVGQHQKEIPSQSIDIYFRKKFK